MRLDNHQQPSTREAHARGSGQRFTGTHRGNGGEPVAIGIDVDRLYFFDLKTGNAIS